MNTVTTTAVESKSGNGNKKILSIVQIVLLFTISILPFIEGMFTWHAYQQLGSWFSKQTMSLSNLMTTQEIGSGPVSFWAFYIVLVGMVAYCVVNLFVELPFMNKKAMIAIPSVLLGLGALMVFTANAHSDSYKYMGLTRYVSVSAEFLAYIFLVLIAAVLVMELYKQFKMND